MGVNYKRSFTLTNEGGSATQLQWTPFRDPNGGNDLEVPPPMPNLAQFFCK